EPGLAGWTVFLDTNLNGVFDANEPSTVTAADDPATPLVVETGKYSFTQPKGNYTVIVMPRAEYEASHPLPVGQVHLRKVADTYTPRPELGGDTFHSINSFWEYAPLIDDENVAFFANTQSDN